MTDQSHEAAVFSELGSSAASFEASRWADFYGSLKGNCCQTADAKQAYRLALRRCSLVASVGWNSLLRLSQMNTTSSLIPYGDLSSFALTPYTVILTLAQVRR